MSNPVAVLVLSGLDYRSRIQYYQVGWGFRYAVLNQPRYLKKRKVYVVFTLWKDVMLEERVSFERQGHNCYICCSMRHLGLEL